MIIKDQLNPLIKKYKINEMTIFREYLQILFLSVLYSFPFSKKIFFKGGTAIHLIYKAPRFSEDLDFTVEIKEKDFLKLIKSLFEKFSKEEEVEFKEKKTIAGKRFSMIAALSSSSKTFINLDFSFREKVLQPQKSIIQTDYPVIFTSYVYHLSKEEIFAEKIRALLTRKKGRDLYDLWYLATQGVIVKSSLVQQKVNYFKLKNITKEKIIERLSQFSEKDFILDVRPFIPLNERERLPSFFEYLKDYLETNLFTASDKLNNIVIR